MDSREISAVCLTIRGRELTKQVPKVLTAGSTEALRLFGSVTKRLVIEAGGTSIVIGVVADCAHGFRRRLISL